MRLGPAEVDSDGRKYAEIAAALAAIPRVRRVALGRRAIGLARKSAAECKLAYFVTVSRRRDEGLLYAVSPRPQAERKERREEFLWLASLAKAYCQVRKLIAICTTTPGRGGGAEDYLLLERPEPPATPEILDAGREMFGDLTKRLSESLPPN
jgi:hypothetical protein